MNNTLLLTGELLTATGASTAIAMTVNTEPLITALITFGVTLVTMAGGELVKFLVAFLKNKTEKYSKDTEDKDKKE